MSGRKLDTVWNYFEKITVPGKTGCRAKCKSCRKELQGLVTRMKLHYEVCRSNDDVQVLDTAEECQIPQPAQPDTAAAASTCDIQVPAKRTCTRSQNQKVQAIDKFVMKTTKTEKEQLDIQIACYVFATNSSFNSVEHSEFKKMIELLRPGYIAPSGKQIGGVLLDSVYMSIQDDSKSHLQNKVVCMALDGWSNVHNEPVICVTVSVPAERSIHLVDTIDTSGNKHTSQYLKALALKSIKSTEDCFGCKVKSFVTDNAANVAKMRDELQKEGNLDVITYGCSAHILNLLAHDVEVKNIKGHIVEIMKHFRNTHLASAWYREAGGKALTLPSDVRWNTLADCLEAYIENWPILVKVCEEKRKEMANEIVNKVNDISLKRNAEDYLARLKPIAVALDRAQRAGSTISDSVEIWKVLEQDLKDVHQPDDIMKKVEEREKMSLGPAHFLANVLDPRYRGKRLSKDEMESAMNYCNENCPPLLPVVINYRATASPFTEYMFTKDVVQHVEPLSWWLCFGEKLELQILDIIKQLFSSCSSSAGVERIFSTFGFIHSKVRNKLGIEKAAKLVTIFKTLNNSVVPKDPYKVIQSLKEAQEAL